MTKEDICETKIINKKKVSQVKKQMIDSKAFQELSKTFKTISDKTRLEILFALSKEELCVCDLSMVIEMSISSVSHQLRILRDKKLVKFRKVGKSVYYSLDDDHVVKLIKMAYDHMIE